MAGRPIFWTVDDHADADQLISVEELALRWRTPVTAVADLVAGGAIPSLDSGELARRGRLNVPVLRQSWAEATRVDSPGAVRRLDLDLGDRLHPAASAAVDLHKALADRDAGAVWQLSSQESRAEAGDPDRLVALWLATLGDVFSARSGIATGVYALTPHRGVGVRLVQGVGPLPVVYDRPTPQAALGIFVFVLEQGRWRADVLLTGADVDFFELVQSAPPEGWSPADGALP